MSDLISRAELFDELNRRGVPYNAEVNMVINGMPSAQPEPIKINIDHELTKEEYEKLRKDMADAPIVLLPSAQPEERTEERTKTHACDCISRQAAIDVTWKEPIYTDPYNVLTEVRDGIKALPSAQQWIPCSERPPKDGERVLATHLGGLNPYKQVIEHIYVNGKFTMGWDMDTNVDSPTFGQRYMGRVIAWMPLPEPWEGEEP